MGRADRGHVRPPLTATESRLRGTPGPGVCVAVLGALAALAARAALLGPALLGATGTAEQDPRLRPPPSPAAGP